MKKNMKETSGMGATAWLLQRVSAVVLFILLMLHFITYHFIAKGVIRYADIATKMNSPWFNLLQFIFLISALFHGLNGLWNIVEDYFHAKMTRILLFSVILLIGISLFFVGTLTIFKVGNLI